MSKNQVMDLFLELKDYGVKSALRGVIDDPNTNEEVKNTIKHNQANGFLTYYINDKEEFNYDVNIISNRYAFEITKI